MKVVKPCYYDNFKCSADKCPSSCCIGWEINIDKKTFQQYQRLSGKIKQKITKSIRRIRNENITYTHYGKFKLDEQERCSFLTQNNLCDIYIELGEQNMCIICRTYPRRLYQYETFMNVV